MKSWNTKFFLASKPPPPTPRHLNLVLFHFLASKHKNNNFFLHNRTRIKGGREKSSDTNDALCVTTLLSFSFNLICINLIFRFTRLHVSCHTSHHPKKSPWNGERMLKAVFRVVFMVLFRGVSFCPFTEANFHLPRLRCILFARFSCLDCGV